MKKFLALTCVVASIFSLQAQTNVKEIYDQGKKLESTYNKTKANPDAAGSKALLECVDLYEKVLEAEQGSEKPKYSKKIMESMMDHALSGDFQRAAITLFNSNEQYPAAFQAFMLSGDLSQASGMVPDTIYAVDYMNAGNSAYGRDFSDAAKAYDAAIAANITEPQAYIYSIGARQNLMSQQPENRDALNNEIQEVAKKGVEKFGYNQDFLLNNYLQPFFEKEDFDSALKVLDEAEKADPNNANIYRLRGIISNAKHDYLNSIPSFVKMSELTDNFDYLIKAVGDLNSIGKAIMGNINNPTPEAKAQILDIFNTSLKIAEKAKSAKDADLNKINYEIEDIEYNIENANKL